MISATCSAVNSPLHAEAKALLLASKLASTIQLNQATLLTDNQVLAKVTAAGDVHSKPGHWQIRSDLAQIANLFKAHSFNIHHIKRDLNGIAHGCAKDAQKRSSIVSPSTFCTNFFHTGMQCPLLLALSNFVLEGFRILDVKCV